MGIGERLRQAREKRGYTQKALGEALGMSRGVVTNIEYDRVTPQPLVAGAICEILQIRSEWLLEGEEPMEDFGTVRRMTRVLSEIAESARMLSPAEQEYVLDMIKTYQAHRAPIRLDAAQVKGADMPQDRP